MDTTGLLHPKPEPRARVKARAKRRQSKADAAVYAAVDARDGGRCRVCMQPGTERHHIVFRSRGGATSEANVLLLDADCHRAVHARRLVIHGRDANARLRFEWRS